MNMIAAVSKVDSCYDYDCGSDDERRLIAAAAVNCCYRVWMAAGGVVGGGMIQSCGVLFWQRKISMRAV